jgi:isopenicillin-N epimerase
MRPTTPLRQYFSLDPAVHFLNHGAFGACPIPVFQVYQEWQRRLERQPVLFLGREINFLEAEARQALAESLNTPAQNLVFVPNATHGVNIIARSLKLGPGEEILTSDHEYGACDYTWEYLCSKSGARYVRQPVALPARNAGEILEQIWCGVTPNTRVIYLSHLTSPTALRLPVEAVCRRAREAGILTLIDGAHAPGQLALDLDQVGADFYTGNLHKWNLAPKGAAFLYAREEVQNLIEPLVVSWGFHAAADFTRGSRFQDLLGWTGTHDPAAYLSVPAAIQFAEKHDWEQVRRDCRRLLQQTLQQICSLQASQPLYPLDSDLYVQMGIAPLPDGIDPVLLKRRLYDDYRVEAPLTEWNGRNFVRISVQGYNSQEDLDALVLGLKELLPQTTLQRKN